MHLGLYEGHWLNGGCLFFLPAEAEEQRKGDTGARCEDDSKRAGHWAGVLPSARERVALSISNRAICG